MVSVFFPPIYLHNWDARNYLRSIMAVSKVYMFNFQRYQQIALQNYYFHLHSGHQGMFACFLPTRIISLFHLPNWKVKSFIPFILFLVRVQILSDVCYSFIIYCWRPISREEIQNIKDNKQIFFLPIPEWFYMWDCVTANRTGYNIITDPMNCIVKTQPLNIEVTIFG